MLKSRPTPKPLSKTENFNIILLKVVTDDQVVDKSTL